MLSFFPRGVLDEILNLTESVSEDFPSYSYINNDPAYRWTPGPLCELTTDGRTSVYLGVEDRYEHEVWV